MSRPLASTALSSTVAALLVGCAYTPNPYSELARTSEAAVLNYEFAKRDWAEVRAAPLDDLDARREADLTVVRRLESARNNSPSCPLYRSRIAELQLGFGAAGTPKAKREFEQALASCEDWIPSHLGLARLAILAGEFDAARQHIVNSKLALARLHDGGAVFEDRTIVLLGLRFNTPPRRDLMDPTMPRQEGYKLLMNLLFEDIQWSIGNGQLVSSSGQAESTPAVVLDQLKAKITYVEFMLHRQERAPDAAPATIDDQLADLETVLRFYPDHPDARFYLAFLRYELRDYQAAFDLLNPESYRHNPMLRSDGPRRDMLARIVTDWYLDHPSAENLARTKATFDYVEQHFGQYPPGSDPILAAAQGLCRGLELRDPSFLNLARDQLLSWQTADVRDAEARRQLALALQQAAAAESELEHAELAREALTPKPATAPQGGR